MVSLADFETLHSVLLNTPEDGNWDDENPPLVGFSPDLELILIGNALLEIRAPKAKPLSLPIPETHGNKLKIFPEHHWTCSFSVCSRYLAIVHSPWGAGQNQARLFLFRIDMQGKMCAHFFEDIYIAQCHKLTVNFHPDRPEMVLNGWILGDPAVGSLAPYSTGGDKIMDVTTILLNLENETSISLGRPTIHGTLDTGKTRRRSGIPDSLLTLLDSPQLPLDGDIKYSACGSYVHINADHGSPLSWPIPGRSKPSTPSTPILPNVVGPTRCHHIDPMCITDLAYALRCYTMDLLPVSDLPPTNTDTARLTVVPAHLREARVTFLLSEGDDPSIRALFSREEGQFEMKYLKFTIKEYMARFEMWYQEACEKRRKSMEEHDRLNNYDSEEEVSD